MSVPESDVAQWNLILDVDQLFSFNYYGDQKQHDVKISPENYSPDNHHDNEYGNFDNNEYSAHHLEEELTQLSISGDPKSPLALPPNEELTQMSIVGDPKSTRAVEEYQQSVGIPQDWYSSESNYYTGHGLALEELDDTGASSSCSTPGDILYDGEEYSYALEITDDSDFSGEVNKRLNQMVSVPYIPRINGDIPSVDVATSDHQRLLDRLKLYDLIEHRVEGDGNCQFRALSDQVYRTAEHHMVVRKQVVNQLKAYPDAYEGYVPMAYGDYLKRMSKSGEWGDHVTLQAAADSYGMRIFVITSFKDTCYLEIQPKIQKSNRVIFLSFWAEVHYNSIYPRGDMPACESKKKKKWWSFRNKQQES